MKANDNDIQIIEQLSSDFYSLSQNIIETYYLQPLTPDSHGHSRPEKKKTHLKDGDIERSVHGAMHVARAQFWALIWHAKMKEMVPEYMAKVCDDVSKTLGLNEKQLLTLIRYAMLLHDCARKNEDQDIWGEESAKECYDFFVQQGLSQNLADLISQAIVLKGKSDEYIRFLQKKQVDNDSIPSLNYIRKLILIADCQDTMRYEMYDDLYHAMKMFDDVKGFNIDTNLNTLVEITRHIYAIIKSQGDMLYPCNIILPDKTRLELNDGESHFSLPKKVAMEHANNVCSAMGNAIQSESYFAPYLSQECFLDTSLAQVAAAFNPYIHGTTSCIFPGLARTQWTMYSSQQLLAEYGMAPMCGELDTDLYGGGTDILNPPPFISFGTAYTKKRVGVVYDLKRVTMSYAGRNDFIPTKKDTCEKINYYSELALTSGFENINKLLIHIARAKQLGIEPLSNEQYVLLQDQLNGLIQFYYFLMLIGKHIYPNIELYNKTKQSLADAVTDTPEMQLKYEKYRENVKKAAPMLVETGYYKDIDEVMEKCGFTYASFLEDKKKSANVIPDVINAYMTFEKLIERIMTSKVDFRHIYSNPTEENLQSALTVLTLPQISVVKVGMANKEKEVTLPETQFFTTQKACNEEAKSWHTERDLYNYTTNGRHAKIGYFLSKCLDGSVSNETFARFEQILSERISVLMKRQETLKKIMENNTDVIKFSPQEMQFFQNPFPIILVCTAEEKIILCEFSTKEYRAYQPLKFGTDITMIATDTWQHQWFITRLLSENNIHGVQVILIEQLSESANTDKKAPVPLTHSDGFPTLSFFAKKALPDTEKGLSSSDSIAEGYTIVVPHPAK